MANVGKAIRKGPLSARRFYDLPMTQSALANTLDNRLIQEYPHSPVIVLPCSSLPGELLGQDQAVRESGPEARKISGGFQRGGDSRMRDRLTERVEMAASISKVEWSVTTF
uniref:Uncharacterized protein n=1 Tax=Leptospirillum ferrodiazotrophum TaxID=412449 RepID=C6HY41_9BACT|nr:MAG: hypothetical protein UBAL3_94170090 [Leptospirillum ferrodiazotrophum]